MSEYEIRIETSAAKSLARIHRPDQTRIVAAINGLKTEPRPHNCIKMTGVDSYRIRIGTYRVIYLIDDTIRIIDITSIGHRKDVYQ